MPLVSIRLPVVWTFTGLVGGLAAGTVLSGTRALDAALQVAGPVGTLWLRGLQMTIIPLVAALLVTGIAKIIAAARAGATARRMIALVFVILLLSGTATVLLMPLLLAAFPIPPGGQALLAGGTAAAATLPSVGDFLTSFVAPNLFAAAAETAMLPLTLFFALFAVALMRLEAAQREVLLRFFHALGNAMLIIIGWVLWLAPAGVFALALGVAAEAGGGAFAAFTHYILAVSAMGLVIVLGGIVLAAVGGRIAPHRFLRAMLPTHAVAISTQSSLASLPAMLASARRLSVRESTADFVLPLAVAIFRATSPAMNLAVVIYIATLAGVDLSAPVLLAGVLVAFIISVGSVSLPGTISFVISIGPIAVTMGVPVEPLALLVAIEMLPDIVRTVGNVTMNVAVASAVDRVQPEAAATALPEPR
ncbi:cation:dicarboxylase symporter family transporter [Erythrobacteraceae bacterium CFH 75059]|nr:cation:dicarboxylase symporter family transporter [Erythrobacteraceae bacterium CFH 75059]